MEEYSVNFTNAMQVHNTIDSTNRLTIQGLFLDCSLTAGLQNRDQTSERRNGRPAGEHATVWRWLNHDTFLLNNKSYEQHPYVVQHNWYYKALSEHKWSKCNLRQLLVSTGNNYAKKGQNSQGTSDIYTALGHVIKLYNQLSIYSTFNEQ